MTVGLQVTRGAVRRPDSTDVFYFLADPASKLRAFRSFWNSAGALVGEPGAKGWQLTVEPAQQAAAPVQAPSPGDALSVTLDPICSACTLPEG